MPHKIKNILITRPKEDAEVLAAALQEMGFNPIIEPLLTIEPIYKDKKLLESLLAKNPQAVLITSKYAVVALAHMTALRNISILTSGETTAACAREAGFKNVASVNDTARVLVEYILKHFEPKNGSILYVRGAEVTEDIEGQLSEKDFSIESVIVYNARPASEFSGNLIEKINRGGVDAVVFFSQNTANTYIKHAVANQLAGAHQNMIAICLSEAIAGTIRQLPWKDIAISNQADVKSMIEKITEYK